MYLVDQFFRLINYSAMEWQLPKTACLVNCYTRYSSSLEIQLYASTILLHNRQLQLALIKSQTRECSFSPSAVGGEGGEGRGELTLLSKPPPSSRICPKIKFPCSFWPKRWSVQLAKHTQYRVQNISLLAAKE